MTNRLDKQYQELLRDIIEFGVEKQDRTGTGTKSIFGYTIRHNMRNGFPLLTTKKMAWKTMVTELLWFLRGDTNIKFLVNNGCHIWDGDAYKRFLTEATLIKEGYESGDILGTQPHIDVMFSNLEELTILTQEEFINKIKTDDEFAKKWGLAIEERELSYDERFRIAYKDLELRKKLESESKMLNYPDGHNKVMNEDNIPTKQITLTYNNETITVYE